MNYIEWNNALAKRYFDDVTEAQTFLCITRDTLKDISALATEQAALDDFIAAVKNGPEWTQIDGCGTIPSKAHNCLYPDPYWSRLRTDSREKHNLAGHVGWRGWKWEGKTLQHPPYLAYLLLLVLSWTERGEADHGGQFYNPLNRILGLEGDKRIESKHLGAAARYKYNNAIITFNDMWQDLEKWSWEDREGAIIDLPPPESYTEDYVFLPRHFGLFTASDLRKLPDLFFQLDERELINFQVTTDPRHLVQTILRLPDVKRYLSTACLKELQDQDRQPAMGHLLISKYFAWDGTPCSSSSRGGGRRGYHRILRVLDNGEFKSVVKIRSESALEKISPEPNKNYSIKGGGNLFNGCNVKYSSGSSLWSETMPFLGDAKDPFAGLSSVECPDLEIKMRMNSWREQGIIVFTNDGSRLPWHLKRKSVEVEDLLRGHRYMVLAPRGTALSLGNLTLSKISDIRPPDGIQLYHLDVPRDIKKEDWPPILPPLVSDQDAPAPRIKISSPFRLDNQETFLAGFTVLVSSNSSLHLPFVKNLVEGVNFRKIDHEERWALISRVSGNLTLALLNDQGEEVPDSDKTLIMVDCGIRVNHSSEWSRLIDEDIPPEEIPPYPAASLDLGLEPLPFLSIKNILFYEAHTSITAKITAVSKGIQPKLRITRVIPASPGQTKPPPPDVFEVSIGEGGHRVEAVERIPRDIILAVVLGEIILDSKTVRFTPKRHSTATAAY